LVDALVIRSRVSGSNAKVAQVFPDQGILASVFPTYFAEYLTEKTRATGVDVNPSVRINSIVETPNKDHKLRITLDNDKVIDTDHLVLSLGGVPNVDLARKAYLEVDQIAGGIAVNAELQARSDLYVAGDVASFYDGHLGRRRVEGIDHAEISGKVAGLNMTGKNKAYTYQPIRWGAVSQNVSYQGVGLIDARLDMVGVWQKGPSAPLIPSGPDGDFIPDPEVPLSTVYEDANKYERGVVYYLDGPKVVGVMMINVNGQMDVAKRLVTFPRQFDDLSRLRTQIYLGNKPKNEDEETGAAPL
jgi:programmed cell death 8 (apoptosis-inducing factor)